MLGTLIAKCRPASGQPGMLTSADLEVYSPRAQKGAAKVVDFPYTMAKGTQHSLFQHPASRSRMILTPPQKLTERFQD